VTHLRFSFIITALILVITCETGCVDLRFVTITTEQKETVQAVFGEPSGSGNRPAVIFNHGSSVRYVGYAAGMYVDDYVRALNEQGYVAIAPLRTEFGQEATVDRRGRLTGTPEQCTEVIAYGLRVVGAARRFLAGRPGVNQEAIAIMGYSEGGNVSLWSAIETPGYRAVVLLSPAAIPPSPRYRLRAATNEELLRRINAPVFLAVATDDFKGIREATSEALIPNLRKFNPVFRYRNDYPGDHNAFKRVRNDLWGDVAAFLKEHLQ
jgi:dienelactone hydrolase